MSQLPNRVYTLNFADQQQVVTVHVLPTSKTRMSLRLNKTAKIIEAHVPAGITEAAIRAFVNPHVGRFVKLLNKIIEQQPYSLAEAFIYIFGKRYQLRVLIGFQKPELVKRNQFFYLKCTRAVEEELVRAINDYAKVELATYLNKALPRFELALNTGPHHYKIMFMRSAWGVNYTAERRLGFHAALIHYQKATIDYVIVHELVHDQVSGHSEAFWNLLASYYPSYQTHRAILRHNQNIAEE